MELLKTVPTETFSTLLSLSISYIQGDFEVLPKVPFTYRDLFSTCVEYLRSKCGKHSTEYLKEVDEDNWSSEHKACLLEKLDFMNSEFSKRKNKERLNEMNWRIDVALSTNSLSRVLKPEVQFKLANATENSEFHMTVQQFQEFRRQTATLIKDIFTMEQFTFIRNLKS